MQGLAPITSARGEGVLNQDGVLHAKPQHNGGPCSAGKFGSWGLLVKYVIVHLQALPAMELISCLNT